MVIAFSGGVDSTLLAVVGTNVLCDHALAVTLVGPLFPSWERDSAIAIAKQRKMNYVLLEVDLLEDPFFLENTPDRCYYCKRLLFARILAFAKERGFSFVAEGSTVDDLHDYRPGRRAVIEMGVLSPLLEGGWTKEEVREASRILGLSTWDRPSNACFATRIPYGERIDRAKISLIAEGEALLRGWGCETCRVRLHRDVVRIEVDPASFPRILERRERLCQYFHTHGYPYVTLDLDGYRSGSLNEVLRDD